jgi:O-antigen/teichoic acid export membrane protein
MNLAKTRRRLLLVATNSLNSLLLPLVNIAVSLLVVRLGSVELWGAFVSVMIVVQLGVHVIGWGNQEYLLRQFSRAPARLGQTWQFSLLTRLLLLPLFTAVIILLGWPAQQALLATVWTVGLVLAQSFNVLVVFRRAFLAAIAVELVSSGVTLTVVFVQGPVLSVDSLLLLFAVTSLARALALGLVFRQDISQSQAPASPAEPRQAIDLYYFQLALPFFLLGLSGLLQSRIDLYSVSYFLSKQEVGQYQVFLSLLLYLQAIANFILQPYVKSIYRLDETIIWKIALQLFGLGWLLIVPAMLAVAWVLATLYGFNPPPSFIVLGGLYVLPIFFDLPIIYALYKADRTATVISVNLTGFTLNLLLNIWLLPRVGLVGAILASAIVHWGVFAFYLSQGLRMRSNRWRLEQAT